MKILFFASYPTLPIGYSRIANILTNFLAVQGHQVYYFGISNFQDNGIKRFIHPNIILIDGWLEEQNSGRTELFGVNSICDWIEKVQPDLLFLYNDVVVISRIFNNFIERKIEKNFVVFTYLDLVYPFEKINLINHVDKFTDLFFVFSDYWKNNLVKLNVNIDKIKILPHGFDNNRFSIIDKQEARLKFNFKPDDFIILNTNRNSYRKCIDKTIDAFIMFLKSKNLNDNIKLFLNMNTDETNKLNSYNINNLIQTSCIKYNVDTQKVLLNHIYINGSNEPLTDEMLNYLYNACDVGINTCIGEGFGLCNLEHGGVAKPQIVSGVGTLTDIFKPYYAFVIKPIAEFYIGETTDFHGGYAQVCATEDFVNAIDKYYSNTELRIIHGLETYKIINNKYSWNSILNNFIVDIDEYFKQINPNYNNDKRIYYTTNDDTSQKLFKNLPN